MAGCAGRAAPAHRQSSEWGGCGRNGRNRWACPCMDYPPSHAKPAPRGRRFLFAQCRCNRSVAAELRAATVGHPDAVAAVAPGAALDARSAGQLAHQLHTSTGVRRALVGAAIGGLTTEQAPKAVVPAIAAAVVAATVGTAHGELAATALRHPHAVAVRTPGAPFYAGAARQLANQFCTSTTITVALACTPIVRLATERLPVTAVAVTTVVAAIPVAAVVAAIVVAATV